MVSNNKMHINKDIKPIIFLGSSVSHQDALRQLKIEANLKPPIKRDDLKQINVKGQVVLIIDGVFYSKRAVAPFEIIELLNKGVIVIGASSMGALRASELDEFGMLGVGSIYNMYKSEEISSDAEVALIFDPVTYVPYTQPLVNIRYALEFVEKSGIITESERQALIKCAGQIYFPNLTYSHLFEVIKPCIEAQKWNKLTECIKNNMEELDLKRKDAIEAIDVINRLYSV